MTLLLKVAGLFIVYKIKICYRFDEVIKVLGAKIKGLRIERNLTQEQLAKDLCVSRQAVAKWENDGGMPDIENIKNLAKYFNLSLDEFIYGNDETKMIKKLGNSILILFSMMGLVTFLLVNELVMEQIVIWSLFASFMIYLGVLVRVIIIRYYNYQVKKKCFEYDELGRLLVEGIGGMYLNPNWDVKAVLSRLKNYLENAIVLGYIQGLVLLVGHKLNDYWHYQEFFKVFPEVKGVSFAYSDYWEILMFVGFYLFFNIMIGEWKVFKHNYKTGTK